MTSDAPPDSVAAALEAGRVGEHLRHVAAYIAGLADDRAKGPDWFARASTAEQLAVEARRLEYTAARTRSIGSTDSPDPRNSCRA
ncbi:hypothetical protein [Embleya sp. MST-111070]|uniref:hypothetical protein n=1 Tax=Embleya sp. MST-111070 TaxID=3398231 RepID=UPI003F7355DC